MQSRLRFLLSRSGPHGSTYSGAGQVRDGTFAGSIGESGDGRVRNASGIQGNSSVPAHTACKTGSAQESGTPRGFGGLVKLAAAAAVAVGMWKPVFCAGSKLRGRSRNAAMRVRCSALGASFPQRTSDYQAFWRARDDSAAVSRQVGVLRKPRQMSTSPDSRSESTSTPTQSPRAIESILRRVALAFLQEPGEHSVGVDFDEGSGAGGQYVAVGVADLGGAEVLAAVHANFPALGDKRRGERHWANEVHLHGSGDGDDAAQLADFAHG